MLEVLLNMNTIQKVKSPLTNIVVCELGILKKLGLFHILVEYIN